MPKIVSEQQLKEKEQEQISDLLAQPEDIEEETNDPSRPEPERVESEVEGDKDIEKVEEVEEVKSEDKQEDKELSKDEIIADLRASLEKMSVGTGESETQPETDQTDKEEKQEQVQVKEEQVDIAQLVSDEEFERVQTDPRAFNAVLMKVYKAAEANAREKVMRDVPTLVQQTASRQATYMQAVNQFYQENEDLKPFRKFVAVTMNEAAAENPEMSLDDLLKETAKRARKGLALAGQAKQKEDQRRDREQDNKPAFAPSTRGSRASKGSDDRSSEQKEIDALINML